MKTTYPLFVVLAMAIAAVMLGMSGFTSGIGQENKVSGELTKDFNNTASNTIVANEDLGPLTGVSAIFGLIVTALGQIFTIVVMVLLLPIQLEKMGFPPFFAYPVGLTAQIFLSIGVLQFASGRMLR